MNGSKKVTFPSASRMGSTGAAMNFFLSFYVCIIMDLFHNHVSLAILVASVVVNLFQIKALFLYHRKTSQNPGFMKFTGTMAWEHWNMKNSIFIQVNCLQK